MTEEKIIVSGKRYKVRISHIFILLFLIIAAAFAFFRYNTKRELNKRLEAIRAAGEPVTFAELNQFYSIPFDVENSAYIILDAAAYYKEPNDLALLPIIGTGKLPARSESMRVDTKEIISQFLADNQKCLELLHKTIGLEYGRYPVDFTLGNGTKIPHLSEMRQLAQLLQLDAILATENGKSDTAFNSIKSIFSATESLNKEPVMVSQLVRISCQLLGVSVIEYTLNRTDFSDGQIVELCAMLKDIEDSNGILFAILGERTFALNMLMYPKSMYFNFSASNNSSNFLSLPPVLFLYKVAGLNESDAILLIDYIDDVIKTLELPLEQRKEASKVLDKKHNNIPKKNILFRKFAPSLGRSITSDLRNIALIRSSRTALSVQRYRLKNNKLPDSLNGLVPDYLESVPLDPYDGKEIRYNKLDKGFVVYSIGKDQKDDGGKEDPKDKSDSTYDITFIVEK